MNYTDIKDKADNLVEPSEHEINLAHLVEIYETENNLMLTAKVPDLDIDLLEVKM